MSNALPMALLRPSCAAMRPTAPVTQTWNTVTLAFARRFCSQKTLLSSDSQKSLLALLPSHRQTALDRQQRSFTSTSHLCAKVRSPDQHAQISAGAQAARKRAVTIGPLPDGMPTLKVIASIFGPKISRVDGYNVLRILHHRRTSGSLVDYGVDHLGARYSAVTHDQATKALEWLRQTYPIDEARAAEEWAEKEANRIAYELWLADPENADSKYNDPARVWRQQQQEIEELKQAEEKKIGILRQGPSEFELNIARKRKERLEAAARAAEEKERQEQEQEKLLATGEYVRTPSGKQLMKPNEEVYVDIFGREQVSRRKEMLEKYRQKAVSTPFKSEEEMRNATTLAQRLYPMTAFVIVTCLICYGIGHYYEPPDPEYRLWPHLSPTTATICAVIATNVFICSMWRFAPAWQFMTKYFMHVPGYPRAVQSVTNIFSHVQYEHLISNMMFFALVGTVCHDLVGRGIFLGTYVAAGAVGTLASLYWANIGRGSFSAHSVGASAAIWGIATLYCLLTDTETVKVPFVKDMEVGFYPKLLLAAFIAQEIRVATRKKQSTMDHASHFGGMLVGMATAGYLRATGFHERRKKVAGTDGVQERAMGGESKTLDVGKLVKEEVGQVKEGVRKIVKE